MRSDRARVTERQQQPFDDAPDHARAEEPLDSGVRADEFDVATIRDHVDGHPHGLFEHEGGVLA